jgi:hypothetical protein
VVTEANVKTIGIEGASWDALGNIVFGTALDVVPTNLIVVTSVTGDPFRADPGCWLAVSRSESQ